tara:strand:- start:433 stop:1641 length:1209 start_codon:yes stop_codon:yes gene_type:complete
LLLDTNKIKNSDISNIFVTTEKVNKGQSVDNAITSLDKIKRPYAFLIIQEHFRRYQNTIEIVKELSHKKSNSNAVLIIQIAIIMIYFSTKPVHSIVNDSVEFAKNFKAPGYVNVILRSVLKEKEKFRSAIKEIKIGNEFKRQIIKIYSSKKIHNFIFNSLDKKPVNYQISYLDDTQAIYDKRVSIIDDLKKIKKQSWVQDIGNYECIRSVKKLIKNKNILDCCAAPGGKSFLLSSFGANVDCIDNQKNQIEKFKSNADRLELDLKIKKQDFLRSNFKNVYDCILLDAPCSSLGTFRRNPDVMLKINKNFLKSKNDKQALMLIHASKMIKPKGYIIYIVCSFHMDETIEVIDKFLKKNTDFNVIELQSDKLIKKNNGYFTNPLSFKKFGGSDIFYISVLERKN